jgi:SAM-dependent methyltransferase
LVFIILPVGNLPGYVIASTGKKRLNHRFMKESSKSQLYWGELEKRVVRGQGIDIGCGPDPVTPNVRRFDLEDGDANIISRHVKDVFDFVYSSHCLEHMHNPRSTILDWWKLVKPGGYLFVVVPDEDLYEQGVFPSRFNSDHKATFTICKTKSWSSKSINVLELANSLPGGKIVSLELQDRGYDRSLMSFGKFETNLGIRLLAKVSRFMGLQERKGIRRLLATYYPLDQTSSAQAQIQLIVEKLA